MATATGAALFDMECTVFMGEEDMERQERIQTKRQKDADAWAKDGSLIQNGKTKISVFLKKKFSHRNSIGMFDETNVKRAKHFRKAGVLHGMRSYLLQNE